MATEILLVMLAAIGLAIFAERFKLQPPPLLYSAALDFSSSARRWRRRMPSAPWRSAASWACRAGS